MATNGYHSSSDQVRRMTGQTKTLLNDGLRRVLREESLTVSGVKSELQYRVIQHIEALSNAGDISALNRVDRLLKAPRQPSSYSAYNNASTPPSSLSPQYPTHVNSYRPPYAMPSHSSPPNRLTFKDSPFYNVIKPLTSVLECKTRESTRDTAHLQVNLTSEDANQLINDPHIRVMVFCAAESSHAPFIHSEIAFPHQVELKCNLDEVKANLRGLKNKPGSTRPADITNFLRKKGGYPNSLQMTYALTTKTFYLVVNMVQKKPVEELVARLRAGKTIQRDRVIQDMNRKAQDPDIVATSTIMSLKCPLSTLRINTPCRSIGCQHNQCFDAASYLQLQEQAPTWTCPICNRYSPFETLAVDLYVEHILKSTSRNDEAVTIEPNGSWSKQSNDGRNNPTPDDDDDDDEEDLVEIPDHRISSLKQDAISFPSPLSARTPPILSREQSQVVSTPRPASKRPAGEVIDLTLSDDDDVPAPKIKRISTSTDPLRDRYRFNLPLPNPSGYSTTPSYDYYGDRS